MNRFDETHLSDNHSAPISTSTTSHVDEPFDLERLRLSQDFAAQVGVKKALTTVPVRKPTRQEFLRVHPDAAWRFETAVLELKDDRETYLVDAALWAELAGEITRKVLFTALNRQGVVFLWPVRLPGEDGRLDAWNRSALEAAQLAMQGWVRVAANLALGAYDVFQAAGAIPDPIWPEVSFPELMQIAFRDRFIRDPNHLVLRKLRGEQ